MGEGADADGRTVRFCACAPAPTNIPAIVVHRVVSQKTDAMHCVQLSGENMMYKVQVIIRVVYFTTAVLPFFFFLSSFYCYSRPSLAIRFVCYPCPAPLALHTLIRGDLKLLLQQFHRVDNHNRRERRRYRLTVVNT